MKRLISRLTFCLQVIDDIFTVLSLHFGVLTYRWLSMYLVHPADDADAHKMQFGDDA